jgi:hypothetical protein
MKGAPGVAPTAKGGWMRGVAGGAAIEIAIVVCAAWAVRGSADAATGIIRATRGAQSDFGIWGLLVKYLM